MKVRGESLAVGGAIVCANPDEARGKKIFVPYLIPEEIAEVSLQKDHGSYQEGKILQILSPDSSRVQPPCVAFGICGGCQLQHMTIAKERKLKVQMIESHLHRQTKLPEIRVISASEDLPEYHYRRRVTFHLSHIGVLGYHRGGTRDVIPIRDCPISEEAIVAIIPKLQKLGERLSGSVKTIEVSNDKDLTFILLLRDGVFFQQLGDIKQALATIAGLGKVFIKTKRETVSWSLKGILPSSSEDGHFSQVNRAGNQKLHDLVLNEIAGDSATELYAGSGNFTFEIARLGLSVQAVEYDMQLVKAGNNKAKQEKLDRKIVFHEAACERWVRRNPLGELVIIDPPRAGAKDVIKLANWSGTKKIVYISCSLPSFARDAEALALHHGFSISRLFFVDMFPQTHHVELVGIFEKI